MRHAARTKKMRPLQKNHYRETREFRPSAAADGIELGGERSRTHEVAEHLGDLASFGGRRRSLPRSGVGGRSRLRRRWRAQPGQGTANAQAMTPARYRLRSALARPKPALGPAFQPGHEARVAQRPADAPRAPAIVAEAGRQGGFMAGLVAVCRGCLSIMR